MFCRKLFTIAARSIGHGALWTFHRAVSTFLPGTPRSETDAKQWKEVFSHNFYIHVIEFKLNKTHGGRLQRATVCAHPGLPNENEGMQPKEPDLQLQIYEMWHRTPMNATMPMEDG